MDRSSQQKRLVEFGELADADFSENHAHTAHLWGLAQADRYSKLILDTAQRAADGEISSRPVEDHPEIRLVYLKWPKARYGHFLLFRKTDKGILVLRILHGAMSIAEHIKGF